uniref:Uncharacterized protein n=1 Tax=Plectus sambesii TaxID=2011161 RepID=A0A914WZT0_9BILA
MPSWQESAFVNCESIAVPCKRRGIAAPSAVCGPASPLFGKHLMKEAQYNSEDDALTSAFGKLARPSPA